MVIQMPILQPDQVCTQIAYPVSNEKDTTVIFRSESPCVLSKNSDTCDICKQEARNVLASKNYTIEEA